MFFGLEWFLVEWNLNPEITEGYDWKETLSSEEHFVNGLIDRWKCRLNDMVLQYSHTK